MNPDFLLSSSVPNSRGFARGDAAAAAALWLPEEYFIEDEDFLLSSHLPTDEDGDDEFWSMDTPTSNNVLSVVTCLENVPDYDDDRANERGPASDSYYSFNRREPRSSRDWVSTLEEPREASVCSYPRKTRAAGFR